MNTPARIVLHCSATPDDREFDVEDLRRWHLDRGWKDVGYHYVIKRNGIIQVGRLESEVGAHVRGRNQGSIGVCFIGNRVFTNHQYDAFFRLYKHFLFLYKIPPTRVKGHYEFDKKKTCPNIEMNSFRKLLWKKFDEIIKP